ncbi:MAG: polysaccharide deacetylase family protein [Chitinophagaceae bacterium]
MIFFNRSKLPLILLSTISIIILSCGQQQQNLADTAVHDSINNKAASSADTLTTSANEIADAATILSKKQVPVLCYHDIKNWPPNLRTSMKEYIVPIQNFKDQMKILHDSGYKTISPDEYYAYLTTGATLPEKPVMITYDDTDEEQFTIGKTEMDKYGFKGVYFIMTISIGRPRYMNKEQIKQLADEGHTIASHTWDHHSVKKYEGDDWDNQLLKSKNTIEGITGKPVQYFAYPFGLWKPEAFPELEKRGYKAAFILSTSRDTTAPLYTIRRMIVPGTWSTASMINSMKKTFNRN